MSAIKFIQGVARKSLTKNQGSGITTIPGAMQSEAKAAEIVALLQKAGIPMNQLDDFIRSEADVLKFLNIIESASKPKVYSGQAAIDQLNKIFPKKGEVIEFPQKTSFKEQVEAMKKSGDIVDPNNLKKNDKVLQRDLFNNSNLNQPGETNIFSNKYLNDLDKKIIDSDAFGYSQKEWNNLSNSSKEKFRRQFDSNYEDAMENTKMAPIETIKTDTVADTITYIKTLEPIKAMKEANSIIARKGKYKDLTPEQSKRILEDTEDHIFQRDPDNLYDYDPEDMAKGGRAGYYTGGITDVEPSLDDIGHGSDSLMARTRLMSPGAQATTSTGLNYLLAEDNDNMRVPFSAGGGGRRAFLKLLASIGGGAAAFKSGLLSLGEGGTKKAVTETVKQATGSGGQVPPYFFKLVNKIKTLGDDVTQTQSLADRQKVTKYKDFQLTEDVTTGRQEIQRMKLVDDVDAPSYYGNPLTEETYMSYTPGENIIGKGGKPVKTQPEYEEGTAYLRTDREYAGEVVDEMSGISDDIFKEVGEEVPEAIRKTKADAKADGGRIGLFLGGGLTAGKGLAREMLKFMSKGSTNAKSPKELLQLYNPKQFNKLLDNPAYTGKISPKTGETADEMILNIIDQTKNDRSSMVGDLIGSARKIKKVDDDIEKYKQTIIKKMLDGGIDEDTAYSFAEKMAKEMKEAAAPQLTSSPPKVTEQGLLELENIQKNLLTKDRQLQATGGLATMLGE